MKAESGKRKCGKGGMMSMLDKLPGMKNLPAGAKDQINNKSFNTMEAIINLLKSG